MLRGTRSDRVRTLSKLEGNTFSKCVVASLTLSLFVNHIVNGTVDIFSDVTLKNSCKSMCMWNEM